jgi:U3 small nucleolar RNA-associated protein 12
MTDHTYLRYECVDSFGLAVDGIIAPGTHNSNVWTAASSQVLRWNVVTATLQQKLSSPSQDSVGTGKAILSDYITALTSCSKAVATGWNTGAVRIYQIDEITEEKTIHSILDESNTGLTEASILLQGHENNVESLAFSEDATKLASGGANGSIVVWDLIAESGLFRLLGHSRVISSLSFWKTNYLLSTSLDGFVKVWDLAGQCCIQTIANHNGQVWSGTLIKLNSLVDERCRFVTGSISGEVRVWNVGTPERVAQSGKGDVINNDDLSLMTLQVKDDLRQKDDVCRFMGSLGVPANVSMPNERITCIRHYGNFVGVLHHNSKVVYIYQIRTVEESIRKKQRRLKRRREKQNIVNTEKKGLKRGILDDDEDIIDDTVIENKNLDQVQDVDEIKTSDEFEYFGMVRASHKIRGFIFCLPSKGFSVKLICALSTNALEVNTLKKEMDDKQQSIVTSKNISLMDMYGHPTGIRSIALSSDDKLVCTVSKNVTKIWNVTKRSCIKSLAPPELTYGLCVLFLPGNTHVIVGTRDGHLLIIDVNSGEVVFSETNAHEGAIWSLDVRRNIREGETLSVLTGSADKSVKFWDIEQQDEMENQPMLVHTRTLQMSDDVLAAKYSYSVTRRLVIVSTLDSNIKVFFDDSLKFFLSLYGHKLPALAFDASDDDAILASCGADKTIKIWGLDFGDTHRTMYGHSDSVTDIKFVKRTHTFFTTSKDGTVRFWDGDRFEQILLLHGHKAEASCLAISRSGAFVLSGGLDRQVRVWERTQDIVFVEEERERELERTFERVSREQETTSDILRKKGNGDDSSEKEEDNDKPQSEMAVKRSVLSISSGDRIMEALERADQELKDIAAFNRSEGAIDKQRKPNILLLGLEPPKYILWILRSIKSAELEQSLLLLTIRHVERLIYYLNSLLKSGHGVEICVRTAIHLITAHQKQVSNEDTSIRNRTKCDEEHVLPVGLHFVVTKKIHTQ